MLELEDIKFIYQVFDLGNALGIGAEIGDKRFGISMPRSGKTLKSLREDKRVLKRKFVAYLQEKKLIV